MSELPRLTPDLPRYPDHGPGGHPGPLPYRAPHTPRPEPGEGEATAALVLAIIPAVFSWIAAVVLALKVLGKPYGGRYNGRGKAIAALVVVTAWVSVTVLLLMIPAMLAPDRDDDGNLVSDGRTQALKLLVGDCSNDLAGEEAVVRYVEVIPCNQPHTGEVYAALDAPDGPYPGDDQVQIYADEQCVAQFEPFYGLPWESAPYDITFLLPTAQSWPDSRRITCTVLSPEPVTGSLKGAAVPTA